MKVWPRKWNKWLRPSSAKVNNTSAVTSSPFLVKDTVASVKDTLTGTTPNTPKETPPTIPPMDAAKINPMGDTPNRDPLVKPQKPLNKETEELQKKGAERKAEEDSFNLM